MSLEPTRELVMRKLRQCFPEPGSAEGVLSILDEYEGDLAAGRARVQLAILMQCRGEANRVRDLVKLAQQDFRDVLVGAEYAEEFAMPPGLRTDEALAIRRRDRERCERWLASDEG